jgi:hypothetical protein
MEPGRKCTRKVGMRPRCSSISRPTTTSPLVPTSGNCRETAMPRPRNLPTRNPISGAAQRNAAMNTIAAVRNIVATNIVNSIATSNARRT